MLLTICALPAAAAVSNWRLDPAASRLTFRATMSGASFTGVFRRWTARIAFDPKALAASKVEASVDVASAVTGDKDRDQALPTADWFSASAFPTATFVTRGFKDLGGGKYLAIGDLRLRGLSRPVNLPFTLVIAGDTARATGSAVVDRTAFGVGQGQWKTGSVVGTQVTVLVNLVAHRAP
jgi:polyisoprenoid-binding protein YceI